MLTAAIALHACLGAVSSALASEHHPKGGFAPFADCALSNPSLTYCVFGGVSGGEFTVGRKTVPIDKTMVLQGGFSGTGELTFYGAEDGNTLSKTALSVPGGLSGILAAGSLPASLRRQFDETLSRGMTSVTMTAELARPASTIGLSTENLLEDKGVVMQLPLKAKLNNPFLGNNCYVGSSTSPILLNLTAATTGPPPPNKPITGSVGTFSFLEGFTLIIAAGTSLVDNAFTVPKATGCGGSYSTVIDPALDANLGLPSAAGHSAAILDATFQLGLAGAVLASE